MAQWNRERRDEARRAMEQIILPRTTQWLECLEKVRLSPCRWVLDTRSGWFSLLYETTEEAKHADAILSQLIADTPELITNRNARFVGFIPKNGTKGKALEFLANAFGISPEQVMAIGDSINDLDMFSGEHSFFSVTIANAEDEIKSVVQKVGGLVTMQPASDGVAEAIRMDIKEVTVNETQQNPNCSEKQS